LSWLPFFELTLLITLILPCGCHQALLTVTCWGRWRTDQLSQDLPVTFAKVESGSLLKLKNAKNPIKNSHFGHVKIALWRHKSSQFVRRVCASYKMVSRGCFRWKFR
jgi:hypothetical protein